MAKTLPEAVEVLTAGPRILIDVTETIEQGLANSDLETTGDVLEEIATCIEDGIALPTVAGSKVLIRPSAIVALEYCLKPAQC